MRTAVQSANAAKYKRKDLPANARKKKAKSSYDTPDLKEAIQFSLVDAMRYAVLQTPFIASPNHISIDIYEPPK